jgi:hypothetical protein
MSLKSVHQIIIAAGFFISLYFAGWCFLSADADGTGYKIAGVVSAFVALGFVGYEIHFLKKTRRLIIH